MVLNDFKLNLDLPNESSDFVILQGNFAGDPNEIITVTTTITMLTNSSESFQDLSNETH